MSVPATAVYSGGFARTQDGALYVTATEGLPFILAQSWVDVTAPADTSENTLATIAIPANTLGANGMIRLFLLLTQTSSVNDKTLRVKLGATTFATRVQTTATHYGYYAWIVNRNATNSQIGTEYASNSGQGTTTTGSENTTAALNLVITGQKETGSETITLNGYTVEIVRP